MTHPDIFAESGGNAAVLVLLGITLVIALVLTVASWPWLRSRNVADRVAALAVIAVVPILIFMAGLERIIDLFRLSP